MDHVWRALGLTVALLAAGQVPPRSDCRAILKRLVSEGRTSAPEAAIRGFYESAAYDLAWVRDRKPTRQAQALIQALRSAAAKGLNPEDYGASRWTTRLDQLRTQASEADLAQFDLDLTISVMRYVSDLHTGRVNPTLFHRGLDLAREDYDPARFIRTRLVDAIDVGVVLDGIEPPFPGYQRTQIALQRYLGLAARGATPRLSLTRKPVEPGSAYAEAANLGHLLGILGDLPAGAIVPDDWYAGDLVSAVKHFQRRHGLDADGRIGNATFRQLNTPLSRRICQLQLTLERYRWVPHQFASPPIVVNIPEFRLRALNEFYTTELEMKVVVGAAYRHQTPVFAGGMKSVIFRPYWDVPLSIQRAEMVPKAVRDRSYLARNGYEVVSFGKAVAAPGAIDDRVLTQLRSGKWHIRQVPGAENALGLVKFLFPNEYNVYMHGTPATQLFAKSRRDFSHGCIRLERPEALAAWVLRNKTEWSPERITEAMHGAKTFTVTLDSPIPVLIVYATAVVQQDGDVYFFDDIYGHDAALEKVLTGGYPHSVPSHTSGARSAHPRE